MCVHPREVVRVVEDLHCKKTVVTNYIPHITLG